jgi:hypothetical protein
MFKGTIIENSLKDKSILNRVQIEKTWQDDDWILHDVLVEEGVGYTCFICGNHTQAGGNWYDKWGIKCTTCQRAIDRKEIPASLAKNKDSWYSKYDLESHFNLKGPILRDWIKKGIIKMRIITNDGKGVHTQLFLIKDNKDFLPPKKLVESHLVKETKDGKDWYHSEPWYKFVNPHEHLKGYKILEYIKK